MIEENEILDKLKLVEVRTGKDRTIKSYVLRNNLLSEEGREIVLSTFPEFGVFFDKEKKLSSQYLFNNDLPLILEIGFGMGASTQIVAEQNPDTNYLGLEVYLEGVVRLLRDSKRRELKNLKIMRFNAVDVLQTMVEDNSIDGFHIFFPDPWPKKKHHKRRLIQPEFVSLLERKLKKGGYIYLATDWQEYADWMLEVLSQEPLLYNRYESVAPPQAWRPMTKFERKGLDKDYKINEIIFEKN